MFSNSDVSCHVYEAPEAARSFDGLDASECDILTWGFAGSYQQIPLNVYSGPCWLLPSPRTLCGRHADRLLTLYVQRGQKLWVRVKTNSRVVILRMNILWRLVPIIDRRKKIENQLISTQM